MIEVQIDDDGLVAQLKKQQEGSWRTDVVRFVNSAARKRDCEHWMIWQELYASFTRRTGFAPVKGKVPKIEQVAQKGLLAELYITASNL